MECIYLGSREMFSRRGMPARNLAGDSVLQNHMVASPQDGRIRESRFWQPSNLEIKFT